MGFPDVKIELDNDALAGIVQFAAGVVGLIGTGESVTGKIQVGEPTVIYSLADAESKGITETDNEAAWLQLKDYFAEVAENRETYIMLVPNTMVLSDMWDYTNANGIKKLIDYAQGRIRLAGSFFIPEASYTPTITDGQDADLVTALVNGQVTAETYFNQQWPFRGVMEHLGFAGDPATVPSLLERTENRMGVVTAGGENHSGVGLFLGRLSKIPVQRKASRIKDDAVALAAAYVGNTAVEDLPSNELLHDKGYITLRTAVGRSGYYWGGDHTATNDQDDFNTFSRGRPMDKLQVLAYTIYFNELDDEVLVTDDGKLTPGFIKYMEGIIEQAVNSQMVGAGELSAFDATIDPSQDIITSGSLEVVLEPTPVGYSTNITVIQRYNNPFQTS